MVEYIQRTGDDNPFDGIDVGAFSRPTFEDIDGDGDLDLVVGEYDGTLHYFENDGSGGYTEATGSDNPFDSIHLESVLVTSTWPYEHSYLREPRSLPAFADADGDGDLDLVVGEYDGTLHYFENDGSGGYTEATGSDNPFDGIDVGTFSAPTFADIDGDGDLDLVVGETWGYLNYYVNDGSGGYTETTGSDNPFDGIDVGFASAPTFADIDGDDDLDLVVGERDGQLRYYVNDGSGGYTEATGSDNPFDGIDVGYNPFGADTAPTFTDVDGDGDLDLVVGEYDGTLQYFENTAEDEVPSVPSDDEYIARTDSDNPFDGIDVGDNSKPTFADVDGDGDLDLIIGELDGTLNYYVNDGSGGYTETTGSYNPFTDINVGTYNSAPAFADVDGDGDLDLVIGESYNFWLNYYENDGNGAYVEVADSDNPFVGSSSFDVSNKQTPTFADVDGDGDLDLIYGETHGEIHYYENDNGAHIKHKGSDNPFDNIRLNFNSVPAFADVDGDGDLDLIVGESSGVLNYYENIDGTYVGVSGRANPFNDIAVESGGTIKGGASPAFADVDGDGDLDLIVGYHDGTLNYYENTASNEALPEPEEPEVEPEEPVTPPEPEEPPVVDVEPEAPVEPEPTVPVEAGYIKRTGDDNPFDSIDVGSDSAPVFVDVDGDGDFDLVVGEKDGFLNYYVNDGSGAYTEATGSDNPFDGIDAGQYSKPTFADIDGDGDLDLVLGEEDGHLNFYENDEGTYVSRTSDESELFDVGRRSAPAFADIDGDGDLDLVLGEEDGALHYFENNEGAYVEVIGSNNPFDGIDVGAYSTPAFADVDIDGDGDFDLVVGEFGFGGLNYYVNDGSGTYTEATGSDNPFDGIDIGLYSTPTFSDIDGDGDFDLVVGNEDGTLNYYENTLGNEVLPEPEEPVTPPEPEEPPVVDVEPETPPEPVQILGNKEANYLTGTAGADFISGRRGDDTLEGGAGSDTLTGGAGSDTFVFGDGDSGVGEGNRDLITDFTIGSDKIDLSSFATSFNAGGAFSNTAGEVIVSGQFVQVDTTGDGAANFEIDLGADLGLSADDFTLGESSEPPEPVQILGNKEANYLTGTVDADFISGRRGDDTLNGGAGNDELNGGAGSDTFVFGEGDGTDVVLDFADNEDVLQLVAADFTQTTGQGIVDTYGSLNTDGDVVLDFGNDNSITFDGLTDLNALADDITFV